MTASFEGHCHFYRLAGYCDGCIDQTGVRTHFHRFGGMVGGTYSGVYYHRNGSLFDNDAQEVTCLQAFVCPDGAASGMTVAAPASSSRLHNVGSARQ